MELELVTEQDDRLVSGPPGEALFKTPLEEAVLVKPWLFVERLSVLRALWLQSESSNWPSGTCPFTGTPVLADDSNNTIPASISLPGPRCVLVLESELEFSLSKGFTVSDTVCCFKYF